MRKIWAHAVNDLSDKLVQRLVPKTTATACEGPEASWFVLCGCFCQGLGCRFLYKECSTCGGVTGCSECVFVGNPC